MSDDQGVVSHRGRARRVEPVGEADPGAGGYNDLYVFDQVASTVQLLYAYPSTSYGVLHPRFSHDGAHLLWSEEYGQLSATPGWEAGRWVSNIGDVSVDSTGKLTLTNIRKLFPTATSGEASSRATDSCPTTAR
jgi:hypothetical protein